MGYSGEIRFEDRSAEAQGGTSPLEPEIVGSASAPRDQYKLPKPMLDVDEEKLDELKIWLEEWLYELISSQQAKQSEWSSYETAYRALPFGPKSFPFQGACNDNIPVIAMAVDPIHARLDTGIFKQDPVFSLKALKKPLMQYTASVERWVDFYQRHMLNLRQIASPRLLEFCKLGTMVFKTCFDREETEILTYDSKNKVEKRTDVRFSGPRVWGISIGDFLFPAGFQAVQSCPIVAERQRTTYWQLKIAERSGKVKNVDAIKNFASRERTALETAREDAANHISLRRYLDDIVIYEVWCDYDINGDDLPERLVLHYHLESRTFLSLRYNWYFSQRKPYTVIPYTVSNESLYGIGISEMVKPFQDAIVRWHQMASDNAYLANIRMYIVKRDAGIEEVPRLFAGKCFFVDDPSKDFKPFQAGDVYPSTLSERQNLFGLMEKRTGVSDYLTGRESPIVGSRATATSTLALIQEGTKRVEEVLENIRAGFSEIIQNCFYIWIQYGVGDVNDIVFGDDKIGLDVEKFFQQLSEQNVNGAVAIDLTATDAQGSRQAMQQMQLQIINTMMMYLDKLLMAGQGALQALDMQQPVYADMVSQVMGAARKMFVDLLTKYDIRNPEDYLPDLETFVNAERLRITGAPVGGGPGMAAAQPPGGGAGPAEGAPGPSGMAPSGGGGGSPSNGSAQTFGGIGDRLANAYNAG